MSVKNEQQKPNTNNNERTIDETMKGFAAEEFELRVERAECDEIIVSLPLPEIFVQAVRDRQIPFYPAEDAEEEELVMAAEEKFAAKIGPFSTCEVNFDDNRLKFFMWNKEQLQQLLKDPEGVKKRFKDAVTDTVEEARTNIAKKYGLAILPEQRSAKP